MTTSRQPTPRERFRDALETDIGRGTDRQLERAVETVRYCLRHGMPGGGYVFSTSNCIYAGMRLARHEFAFDIWRREGNY